MDTVSDPLNDGSGASPSSKRAKQTIPASLKISSFLSFQKQTQPSPIKRKPLPPNSVLSPTSLRPQNNAIEPDPLTLKVLNNDKPVGVPVESNKSPDFVVRDLDQFPRGQTPLLRQGPDFPRLSKRLSKGSQSGKNGQRKSKGSQPLSLGDAHLIQESEDTMPRPEIQRSITTGLRANGHPPPLRVDKTQRSFSSSSADAKGPRTPGHKITNFFGWKNSSPGGESTSTEISEHGQSSLPSPSATSPQTSSYSLRSNGLNIDVTKANNAAFRDGQLGGAILPPPTTEGDLFRRVAQLEAELKEISAELAGSIRREMDLEDAVERLQSEAPQTLEYNQRTSDYFSDSGTSSVRANPEPNVKAAEDIERIKRRSEQERAQLKVTLSQKWQEERSKRKALEAHVQILEDKVAQSRRDKLDNSDLAAKAKEMETSLDDARRRLAEERQTKENFEDLLTALRVDLEQHRNERDNLRDEVVPQLKTQVQGLESSAAEATRISYDHARLQQEVEKLRTENSVLVNARKMQQEMQQTQARFGTINEEDETRAQSPVGLSRSNSLARAPSRAGLARSGSLSRSGSISGKGREPPESLVERIKDIETQRDALHSAVKSLLERNNAQTRDYEKRIKYLEIERDRALQSSSPRRQGYEKEVKSLREEINTLRKRADEAVEQKYQCEKGLGGLKMDLDRAEQETSTLRKLLQEHDIALPEHVNSSLEASYNQLQRERQQIQHQSQYRSLEEEQILADQLSASAARSEALAAQVRQQLLTNNTLRTRLAQAVSKGELSQRTSASRINELQGRLKKLEDTVTIAQQQSETAVMKHEEEIRILKDSHSMQLHRVRSGIRTPTNFSPKSPLSPLFATRSPRLDKTTSGPGMPLNQVLKTEWLEKKVKELETALGDADKEMEEVVGRMNMAQIEVAELQSERDEALRQTRKLQAEITAEREKVKALVAGTARQ